MQGHPKLRFMPDYVPACVSPSAEPPSVEGTPQIPDDAECTRDCLHAFDCNGSCQGAFSDAVAAQLHNPFTCWDCE